MTVAAWATDLTTIDTDPTGTGSYAAVGGGAAGLNAETDYYVQGGGTPSCASKNAWTNAVKGLGNDTDGTPWTIPTDGVVVVWGYYSAPASLDTKAGGGLRILVGSTAANYDEFYCGGSDTLTFESWVPYVVDPNNATADSTVGSPSGTESFLGLAADLPTTSGPTKGAPIAIDALRYGRHTLEYTFGTSADPRNTFALAEATANSLANRWGNIEFNKGAYYVQGFHSFGTASNEVDFVDSNVVIFIRDSGGNNLTDDAVSTAYNRFEILNASTNVDWTNIQFTSLGSRSPGTFVHTAGTFDAVDCQFTDVGTFTLLSTSNMTGCIFRGCDQITAPGSDLSDSQVIESVVAANDSAVVWNVAADPDTDMDGMEFTANTGTLSHAIEFGTTSPLTMNLRNMVFTGYSASNNVNDSVLHIKRTTGTVTINTFSVTGTVSYRSDGADVVIVPDPVTVSVTCKETDGTNIENANVMVRAASGGPFPYEETVTIANSGTTATVTHTAHGLATNDKVRIIGATHEENNGIWSITFSDANTYTYTMGSAPGSSPSADRIIYNQDETSYDDSPTTEGTFSGGTAHAATDVLTLDGGVQVTVDTVSSGVVTEFTVTHPKKGAGYSAGDTLNQTGSTGSGVDFSLTLDTDNLGISATFVCLEGLTNASGVLSTSRAYASDQPIGEAWARKSTASPYFKVAGIQGTVDSADGFSTTLTMISDE